MASQRILDLLNALKAGTENKRLIWEDLPDEEMFRAQIGGGLIRIGKSEDDKGYSLWLMGQGGAIVAEATFFPKDTGYGLIEDVYATARLSARGGDHLLDYIIQVLNPTQP